jgi:hypothetical protein
MSDKKNPFPDFGRFKGGQEPVRPFVPPAPAPPVDRVPANKPSAPNKEK